MGKDSMIKILQDQLEVSRANIVQLNLTVKNLHQTISSLHQTITNLESLLKERDASIDKVNAQMRGLKSTFLPKQSEKQKS